MPAWLVLTATIIVPGSGHVLLRRYLRGVILATLYFAALDVLLVTWMLPVEGSISPAMVSAAVALAVWLTALLSVLVLLNRLRNKDLGARQEARLREAQTAWLRDELDRAETLLREMLARNERDVEAWVHLGKVLKARGNLGDARRCFRSALNLGGSRPWRWDLRRELGEVDIPATESDAS